MSNETKHPETLVLHAGWRRDPATNAVAVPIYQTTSYQFDSAEHAANLFGLKELGNIYTRIMNPTQDAFEKRVAAVEGGVAALGLASGQAASAFSVQNLARAGDNIVSSTDLYGGTWNLFANTLKDQGIEARFVDPGDPEAIGRKFGIPLIMDNTAAPTLVRPFEHGAAVVMYSTTKYIGGHGTSIGGVVIDGGNFDWEANPARQPAMNTPDPSYHGAVWSQAVKPLGPIAYILKMRVTLLRDLGAAMAPFNAFLFLQGVETLALRMRAHSENALAVANYLAERKGVSRVIHPAHHSGIGAERTAKYLPRGQGGLVGFELAGGADAGRRFIDSLKLFYHVANIGDARSLAIHPASTTHSQLTESEQAATGVTPGYFRLSVGLEHIDDILADLAQALDAANV